MASIRVRAAHQEDHQQIYNLIQFEPYIHRHLDWKHPIDWIGSRPFFVIEKDGRIIAALACPPDPPEVAWVRIFACSSELTVGEAWRMLWRRVVEVLRVDPEIQVASLALSPWYMELLQQEGFEYTHKVVALSWQGQSIPNPDIRFQGASIQIREMTRADLKEVTSIDNRAFATVWRNSFSSLELAFEKAAVATVLENEYKLVGYQISTTAPLGGHLARLAVCPDQQGLGYGYALVHDMIQRFKHLGALQVTVNTQFDNQSSLRLYQKAGFKFMGEEYPVYQYTL